MPICVNLYGMEEEKKDKNGQDYTDRLLKTRSILISGEINKDQADSFTKQMLILDSENNDPIYVYINSPGGDVYSGFAIHDMIRYVSSPVYVIGEGLVASAAALIYLAADKDKRLAFPHSTYLIHQPLSQMKGVASDMAIQAEKMEGLRRELDRLIADATGKSVEDVSRDTERDCWLTAKEALEYGIVDRIITKKSGI